MIKEDLEDKKYLIFINDDYSFIFIDYIYLFLSQKLKNGKKLIILSLLFATLTIKNKNIYEFKHLQNLNKNGFYMNDNNYNIINNYDIPKRNGTI